MVIGRHLFDLTNRWEGTPPAGDHVVVVSHRPRPGDWQPSGIHSIHPRQWQASYYFISDVAQAIAMLEDPHTVIEGDRVLHLGYRVRR